MHDKHDKYCLSFSFLLSFFSVARLRAAVLLSVAHGDSGDHVVFPNVLKCNGGGQGPVAPPERKFYPKLGSKVLTRGLVTTS